MMPPMRPPDAEQTYGQRSRVYQKNGLGKPSKAVKDKVVTAKKFHARVRAKDIDLSQETKQKITALFSEIAKKLVAT